MGKTALALIHEVNNIFNESPEDFKGIDRASVKLYMDLDNWEEIVEILKNDRPRFKLIVREIFSGRFNDSLYKKEDENIAAMRFLGNPNSRIYCKEIRDNGKRVVVMARALPHKSKEKNDKKIKDILTGIKNTDYTLTDDKKEAQKYLQDKENQ